MTTGEPLRTNQPLAKSANPRCRALRSGFVNAIFADGFLAAAESLAGRRGLPAELDWPPNSETIRDAKGWLGERIRGGGYHPVSDQPGLTQVFDMDLAGARSRSFRKFVKECEGALANA